MRKQINHARRNATFNIAELRRRGYRQIGRGAFSRVMVHDDAPDVVIKISRRSCRRLPGLQDAFPSFAERILNREISSKFYPKIYDLRYDDDKALIIMKRYHKMPRNTETAETICGTLIQIQHGRTWAPTDRRFERALSVFANSARYCNDLHRGNVMQDEHGTPILTDPVCLRSFA